MQSYRLVYDGLISDEEYQKAIPLIKEYLEICVRGVI